MKNMAKKIVVFSLIGLMQVGVGASITEASARYDNNHSEHRYEERCKDHHNNNHHNRERRIQEENDRHEREMRRLDYENEREYRERQEREKEHHEEIMRTLGGLALLAIVLNN